MSLGTRAPQYICKFAGLQCELIGSNGSDRYLLALLHRVVMVRRVATDSNDVVAGLVVLK